MSAFVLLVVILLSINNVSNRCPPDSGKPTECDNNRVFDNRNLPDV